MSTFEPFLQTSPFHQFAGAIPEIRERATPLVDTRRGNRVAVLNHGYESLLLRIHLIRNAKRSIDVQTFIWDFDESGRLLFFELVEAARRGIRVRVLIDHVGARLPTDFQAFLSTATPNLEVRYYRPLAPGLSKPPPVVGFTTLVFHGRANQRMHNKLFTVDEAITITGGRNYDNHYYNRSLTYNFKDRDVMVMGPAVKPAADSFEEYWNDKRVVRAEDLVDVALQIEKDDFKRYETRDDYQLDGFFDNIEAQLGDAEFIRSRFIDAFYEADYVTFVTDEPGKNDWFGLLRFWGGGTATRALRGIVEQTEDELVIQSPYAVVSRAARRTFKKIKSQSPEADVIISTNSLAATDNVFAYSANYRLRSVYIDNLDFHLYEYMPHPDDLNHYLPEFPTLEARANNDDSDDSPPFLCLHGKSFVMDRRVTFIGTYNLDPRSFNLNTECGFLIEDDEVAQAVRADILRDIGPDNSWVIAESETPLGEVNSLLERISRLSPIDFWPVRNTSTYQLREGHEPVPRDHPEFHDRYIDVGRFAGTELGTNSEFLASFYKTFGKLATPGL